MLMSDEENSRELGVFERWDVFMLFDLNHRDEELLVEKTGRSGMGLINASRAGTAQTSLCEASGERWCGRAEMPKVLRGSHKVLKYQQRKQHGVGW